LLFNQIRVRYQTSNGARLGIEVPPGLLAIANQMIES
jgi:hypothetical protein